MDTDPHPRRVTTRVTIERPCPICLASYVPAGRQRYCSHACRQRAYRWRQTQTAPEKPPATRPHRTTSVYQCPECETRYLDEQRCPDCNTFCRRIGVGGPCPHCDEPVAAKDLLDPTP